ncbi:glycoside hydrolase family 30 protein [Defluviitalea phaphyphila]|uniref:glycoside hydrolase family 30 protein n=1 Tax=Defluviitalea phaphyphila TaxID=1473580 RepID=UPI0007309740|nr:glycoside hydrolase family 30 protein [Defluviitalea phaphyphila]
MSKKLNKITIIQSVKDTDDRLKKKEEIYFKKLKDEENDKNLLTVDINPNEKFQEIIGFGGAFTDAGAYVLSQISSNQRDEIIRAYFHPEEGIGYTFCRTHINSCDFSTENYSYDEVEGDIELKHFDISRDRVRLIPFIKDAMKVEGANFKLFASPWSPPAWMKTNGEMNNGGKLKEEYKDVWARYYAKYIKEYEKEGINIWGITVQNEPDATQVWDSCRYTAEEERDFVKNNLGPTLKKEGLEHIKIMVWDHNRDALYDRAKVILSDKEAAKYIWGIGFHWYSGDQFYNLAKTHEEFPDKKLVFTEGCIEGGVKLGSWDIGERYGYNIINDLNNWTVAWVDWNMVLNEKGGPNHVGNYCDAPIIVDTNNKKIYYQSSYYYLGHFSKYIRPGAKRIGCKTENKDIQTTAFINKDGKVVVIIMNPTGKSFDFQLKLDDNIAKYKSLAHSIMTLICE